MTTTKTNTTAKATFAISAIAIACAIAILAPATAEARAHADVDVTTDVPVAVQGKIRATSGSPVDDGMKAVIDEACALAASKGAELLDSKTQTVRDRISQAATQAAERMSAQATSHVQATNVGAAPTGTAAPAATPAPAPAPATPAPSTINVDGSVLSYVDTYKASTAPKTGAGLWMGSDSTTDGSWGYFIGHNPGPFHHVMDLKGGEPVTVTDRYGATRTYHVIDVFTITNTTYWEEIQGRVTGHGESVVLQTCVGDGAHYRVVVAV